MVSDGIYLMIPAMPGEFGCAREAVDADGIDILENTASVHQLQPLEIQRPRSGQYCLLTPFAGPVCRAADHFAENLPIRIDSGVPFVQAVGLVPQLNPIEVIAEPGDHHVDEVRVRFGSLRRRRKLRYDAQSSGV